MRARFCRIGANRINFADDMEAGHVAPTTAHVAPLIRTTGDELVSRLSPNARAYASVLTLTLVSVIPGPERSEGARNP